MRRKPFFYQSFTHKKRQVVPQANPVTFFIPRNQLSICKIREYKLVCGSCFVWTRCKNPYASSSIEMAIFLQRATEKSVLNHTIREYVIKRYTWWYYICNTSNVALYSRRPKEIALSHKMLQVRYPSLCKCSTVHDTLPTKLNVDTTDVCFLCFKCCIKSSSKCSKLPYSLLL